MPFTKRFTAALATSALACLLTASGAFASTNQVAMIQDNSALAGNVAGTLSAMKATGATLVKVGVYWNQIAPSPNSSKAPAGFSPSNPADYGQAFAWLDQVVRTATADGLKVGFNVTGSANAGAPLWADGSGRPGSLHNGTWEPSGLQYQSFMNALGKRYSGSYTPSGASSPLPRVSWWSLWNEPNYGPELSPQGIDGGRVVKSAAAYRALVNGGWNGLRAAGHTTSGDTILIGELAPRGNTVPGTSNGTKPLLFLAALYCASPSGHRLTGSAAKANGCPSSAGAFKAANPGLFHASGVAIHPYTQGIYPTMPTYGCNPNTFCWNGHRSDPYYADFAELGRLGSDLDHLESLYGGGNRFALWNTEYGYWTNPPDHQQHSLPTATAALYMNWAEYLSYKNPRIASYSQYQLYDPPTPIWADGLLTHGGAPKLTLNAFAMPLFLPTTSASHPTSLTVWGGARPAAYSLGTAPVQIQFAPAGGSFRTLKTVSLGNSRGYFQTSVPFTKSGTVRLAWTSPSGATLTSRTQAITIR